MYMGGDMLYLYMFVGYNVLSLQLSFCLYVVNKYVTHVMKIQLLLVYNYHFRCIILLGSIYNLSLCRNFKNLCGCHFLCRYAQLISCKCQQHVNMYTVTVKPFDLHLDALKRDEFCCVGKQTVLKKYRQALLNVSNEFINFGTGNEIEMDSIANLLCWYRMVSLTVIVVTHIKLIWIMTCDLCLLNQTFDMTIESLKKILFTLLYPSCAVNHYMYLQQNFIFFILFTNCLA